MPWQFSKHYTVMEARALLPQVRAWLGQLADCQEKLKALQSRLSELLAEGDDIGGPVVNHNVKTIAAYKIVLEYFRSREIQLKDIQRGLIDFPSLRGGREVFLCWESDEDDIEFWHDLEAGYAGRERL
jgi:hypothetical protein